MTQYINKDALVAEIERQQRKLCLLGQSHEIELSKSVAIQNGVYCSLLSFLDTLEAKEVDLDGERRKYLTEHFNVYEDGILQSKRSNLPLDTYDVIKIAKHFFELGLNTQHSSINIPNIDDILEESGIDPYSKEAKIFKESYYMALGKLKEQKGEEL